MRTIPLFLLAACATEPLTSATDHAATRTVWEPREHRLCDLNLCFIHYSVDSDNDGVGDDDEKAVGTDLADPNSRPRVPEIVKLIPQRSLPSFEEGNSMVIVLPTVDPAGEPIFGGEALLPARRSLIEKLGIGLPGHVDIDLAQGFTLARSLDGATIDYDSLTWAKPVPTKDTTADGSAKDIADAASAISDAIPYVPIERVELDPGGGATRTGTIVDADGTEFTFNVWSGPAGRKVDVKNDTYSVHVDTWTDSDGTQHSKKTIVAGGKTQTESTDTSADGKQKYHTRLDGRSEVCDESGCFTTRPANPGDGDDGVAPEPGLAHSDPDYVEYQASPEEIDAILAGVGEPVYVVNPIDDFLNQNDAKEAVVIPALFGPVSIYDPDNMTVSSEPVFIHMPRGGDYSQESQNAPTPTNNNQGGQCRYCQTD